MGNGFVCHSPLIGHSQTCHLGHITRDEDLDEEQTQGPDGGGD